MIVDMDVLALTIGYVVIWTSSVMALAFIVVWVIPQFVWSTARRTRYARVLWKAMRRVWYEEHGEESPDVPGAQKRDNW